MKQGKKFDCVEMKWEIQEKLMEEERGLSVAERNRLAEQRIAADPILGPWFARVRRRQTHALEVAEAAPEYGGGKAAPKRRK